MNEKIDLALQRLGRKRDEIEQAMMFLENPCLSVADLDGVVVFAHGDLVSFEVHNDDEFKRVRQALGPTVRFHMETEVVSSENRRGEGVYRYRVRVYRGNGVSVHICFEPEPGCEMIQTGEVIVVPVYACQKG